MTSSAPQNSTRRRARGSAMIEFAVVGPIITLLGLACLQYGLIFFAKNQMNHADFMAARAGAMGNAKIDNVRKAYVTAMIPMHGGGRDSTELAASFGKAQKSAGINCAPPTDKINHLCIELLNPTTESFDDHNDSTLESKNGARTIPNGGQAYKDPAKIGATSGQSIQDANLIKLRVTHGYEPTVPLIKMVYTTYLKWMDTGTDTYHSQLIRQGLVPVVSNVTLQMQSDPIEDGNVSTPGAGNNGNPTNPGNPPVVVTDPPNCLTIGCSVPSTPVDPGGGGNCGGGGCPVCP